MEKHIWENEQKKQNRMLFDFLPENQKPEETDAEAVRENAEKNPAK